MLESIRSGKKPAEWTGADLQRFDPAMQPDMVKFMNPTEGLKTRSVLGGTAPIRVKEAIAEAKTRLAAYRATISR